MLPLRSTTYTFVLILYVYQGMCSTYVELNDHRNSLPPESSVKCDEVSRGSYRFRTRAQALRLLFAAIRARFVNSSARMHLRLAPAICYHLLSRYLCRHLSSIRSMHVKKKHSRWFQHTYMSQRVEKRLHAHHVCNRCSTEARPLAIGDMTAYGQASGCILSCERSSGVRLGLAEYIYCRIRAADHPPLSQSLPLAHLASLLLTCARLAARPHHHAPKKASSPPLEGRGAPATATDVKELATYALPR